jgi:hypothetical protein
VHLGQVRGGVATGAQLAQRPGTSPAATTSTSPSAMACSMVASTA